MTRYRRFEFHKVTTGGGCTALRYDFEGEIYALVTDGDAGIPECGCDDYVVGFYKDNDGEQEELVEPVSVDCWADVQGVFLRAISTHNLKPKGPRPSNR